MLFVVKTHLSEIQLLGRLLFTIDDKKSGVYKFSKIEHNTLTKHEERRKK